MTFSSDLNVKNFQRVLLATIKADAIAFVAVCILLKRLSNPHRCKDMVPLFERNSTKLCLKFTLNFIFRRHHHILESWNLFFVQSPYLQRYADAVAGKGAPL